MVLIAFFLMDSGFSWLPYDQPLDKLRIHRIILAPGLFCSRNWAVIAQNVIRSPHSHVTKVVPRFSPRAAESMTGLFVIVFLQRGQVI
jgi:hypothetical protein